MSNKAICKAVCGMILMSLIFTSGIIPDSFISVKAVERDSSLDSTKKDSKSTSKKKSDKKKTQSKTKDSKKKGSKVSEDEIIDAFTEYATDLDYINGCVGYFDTDFDSNYEYERDYFSVPNGLIDFYIEDFDNDGQDEMLLEGYDDGNLTFSMMEYDDGVVEADVYRTDRYVLSGDHDDILVFYYDDDYDDRYIGIVSEGWFGFLVDGAFIDVQVLKYEDDEFDVECQTNTSGSDGMIDKSFYKPLKKCGINLKQSEYYSTDMTKDIMNATDGTRLFSIEMDTNDVCAAPEKSGLMYSRLAGYVRFKGYSPNKFTRNEGPDPDEDYIIPGSSYVKLNKSDLKGLTNDELRIARNEIVARHGRKFNDADLQRYFDSKGWYRGTIKADDFNKKVRLAKVEEDNMELIRKYEKN